MKADSMTGMVMNIQRYSLEDGPGIRTTVFLKGCSLRCKWCCNPESIDPRPELAYNSGGCIGIKECGACIAACREAAVYTVGSCEQVSLNWDLCTNCGSCVSVCPSGALHMFGQEMRVAEVLEEVERDGAFYSGSGGGISLSGGECLIQPGFTAALLAEAHRRRINTSIETAANVPWAFLEHVLPHVDTVFHDLKLMDPVRHRKWTGVENARILENFSRAYRTFPHKVFVARSPIIPGVNDTEDHVRSVLSFILPHKNVVRYELLPYHRLGEGKYGYLGKVYELRDFTPPDSKRVRELQNIIDEAFEMRSHLT